MKILILGSSKISYEPYANIYYDNLSNENNEIHWAYWNRDNNNDMSLPKGVIGHEFNYLMPDELSKLKKIKGYSAYRKFAKKLLTEYEFDLIVMLTTVPTMILSDILLRKYRKKYIFDYRDITYEKYGIFRRRVNQIINNSIFTFISSKGYNSYLALNENIYCTHNLLLKDINNRKNRSSFSRVHNPIRISYWGLLRDKALNKIIIDALGNDKRFELHYYGKKEKTVLELELYSMEMQYTNIFFHGAYILNERYNFVKNTDMIHNIYDNKTYMRISMSNKYYDGAVFYLPQICIKHSMMGNIVHSSGIGMVIDSIDADLADKIFEYYQGIDWIKFEKKCDLELKTVMREYSEVSKLIANIHTRLE